MARAFVGTSGWVYPPWRGTFYPEGVKQKDELAYAASRLTSLEINASFYRLQAPKTYAKWRDETPAGFVFAVKANKYATHERRLKDVETPLANFLASGLLALGPKLGPILWQFPPTLTLKDSRFHDFMAMLPHTTAAAAKLGEGHSDWLKEKSFLAIDQDRPLRHAFEFRHKSCNDPALLAAMRTHGIGLVLADSGKHAIPAQDVTGDFVYVRMHGQSEHHYEDGYSETELVTWNDRVRAWTTGSAAAETVRLLPPEAAVARDVFLFFDNDEKDNAPRDARRFLAISGQAPQEKTAMNRPKRQRKAPTGVEAPKAARGRGR